MFKYFISLFYKNILRSNYIIYIMSNNRDRDNKNNRITKKDKRDNKRDDKRNDKKEDKKRKRESSDSDDEDDCCNNKSPKQNKLTIKFIDLNNPDELNELFGPPPPLERQNAVDPYPYAYVSDICKNPLCDHIYDELFIPTITDIQVNSIHDLIELGKHYHCKNLKEYRGISLEIIFNLIEPLNELVNLIGMQEVKQSMVDQILFFLQKLNHKDKCNKCLDCILQQPCYNKDINEEMLHTVITGPPGVGKTELGKILGKVYKAMGVLSKGHFNIARRPDLVGKYLGQTAHRTQEFIDKCKGGVMFIDEAYSLGNPEGRDSFAKECIDTINQNLTERRDFLCIIAGYEKALEESFFSYNDGLKRRFSFRYDIKGYTYDELCDMFLLKINNEGWEYQDEKDKLLNFFKKNLEDFPRFGGDVETLFLKAKIMHSKRILFKDPIIRKKLNYDDVDKGFKNFFKHRNVEEEKLPPKISHMYI